MNTGQILPPANRLWGYRMCTQVGNWSSVGALAPPTALKGIQEQRSHAVRLLPSGDMVVGPVLEMNGTPLSAVLGVPPHAPTESALRVI